MNFDYNETILNSNIKLDNLYWIKVLQSQGKSNFNPIEYWKETQKEEIYKEWFSSLSKKEQKKLRVGQKAQNIKNNVKKKQNDDKRTHDEFLYNKVNDYKNININCKEDYISLKTDEGQVKLLILMLQKAINDSNIELVKHLYLSISDIKSENNQKQIDNLKKKVNNIFDFKEKWFQIQMEEMYYYLPPLDIFSSKEKKLDKWQIDIFKMIDEKKNIIIVAKTSSGKTVCSTYVVFKYSKVLYVLPTAELARQVAGILRNSLKGNVALLTDKEKFVENDSFKVLVGTPYALETFIMANYMNLNFEYVVYDEIHQINEEEGDSLQRIIKLLNCNFLALSATVENPNELKNWWIEIKKKPVELVVHDSRFIVQQRYLWLNNKLSILHPLSAVDIEYILKDGLIKGTMAFTPKDSYDLYNKLKLRGINVDPKKIFGNKERLTLDDSKIYEKYLKLEIKKIALSNPEIVNNILDEYKIDETSINKELNIYKLLRELYESGKVPLICYKLDESEIKEIYINFIKQLEKLEEEEYPYYRKDVELQHEYYLKYIEKKNSRLENLKIPKGEDPGKFKDKILKEINQEMLSSLNSKFYEIISQRKLKVNESDLPEKKRNHHIQYCNKLLKTLSSKKLLSDVNPYQPHPKYSFNNDNITDDSMREIKRKLCKEFGYLIDYSHIFMRGLERGIIFYGNNLPLPFQRMGQSLLSERKVSVIFSDTTLAYGVNLPIRTVIMIGDNINPLVAQQMSGRAGRRGVDNQGHVVYVNTNWKNIMRGELPILEGKYSFNSFSILPLQFMKLDECIIKKQFELSLEEFINKNRIEDIYKTNKNNFQKLRILNDSKEIVNKIIWTLRNKGDNLLILTIYFEYLMEKYKDVKQHNIFNISKEVFIDLIAIFDDLSTESNLKIENTKCVLMSKLLNSKYNYNLNLLNKDSTLLVCYNENRIEDDIVNIVNIVNRFQKINHCVAVIHKYILGTKYDVQKKIFEFIHERIKLLLRKY
jgi:hypothetical protein